MRRAINDYPESVDVDGTLYPVRSDYKNALLILDAGDDMELSQEECLAVQLNIFYRDFASVRRRPDLIKFISAMTGFLRCGKQSIGSVTEIKTLDYRQDWQYIVAAFQKDYGIDLSKTDDIHWWRFCALLNGLSEDNMITKIVGYRGVNLSDIKDKNMRKFYAKMKQTYMLKTSQDEIDLEEQADLEFIRQAELKRKTA